MKSQGGEGHPTKNINEEGYLDLSHYVLELLLKTFY